METASRPGLPLTTLLFAIAYAVCLIGPPELGKGHFPFYPDMQWEDVLDLAVPVIMLPAYWFLVRQRGGAPALSTAEFLAFLVLGAVWIEGQGMHLAANSVNNLIHEDPTVPGAQLIHFYDEVLSHYLWHGATVGLVALALVRQLRHPVAGLRSRLVTEAVAGLVYGLTWFITVVEGATGPLGVPAAVVLAALAYAPSRGRLRQEPVAAFLLVGHALAVVLFGAWWVYWGGSLPEFSKVGWF